MKQNPVRKKWFKVVKSVLKLVIKKPEYVFLSEKPTGTCIILSNHVGKTVPLTLEYHFDHPFRFWGTYEMNGNLKRVYIYLSEIFYHQKKHWNLVLARLFSLIAAPVAYMFYRGLNLISTYPDYRFKNSLKESIKTLQNGTSLIIFPEDSSKGYFDEITSFSAGFVILFRECIKKNMDFPVYVSYLNEKTRKHVFSAPVMLSKLLEETPNKEELAEKLKIQCNSLRNVNA